MGFRDQRGQHLVEYAVLFALVVTAFVTMQVYARRGLQARVRNATDALTSVSGEIGGVTFSNANPQYEPYYQESFGQSYQESVDREQMGGGKIVKEKVSEVTAREAGAYERQKGAKNRTTADALW